MERHLRLRDLTRLPICLVAFGSIAISTAMGQSQPVTAKTTAVYAKKDYIGYWSSEFSGKNGLKAYINLTLNRDGTGVYTMGGNRSHRKPVDRQIYWKFGGKGLVLTYTPHSTKVGAFLDTTKMMGTLSADKQTLTILEFPDQKVPDVFKRVTVLPDLTRIPPWKLPTRPVPLPSVKSPHR